MMRLIWTLESLVSNRYLSIMIYGRRVIENRHRSHRRKGMRIPILNKSFQYKYTLFLLAAVGGAVLLFVGPAYYFMRQNYAIFINLAYDVSPGLIEHLEREVTWLTSFFIVAGLFTIGFCSYIGLKMTGNIVAPLMAMEKHVKTITTGDWTTPDFKTRELDEFKDLAIAYGYLYRSLKVHTEAELKTLESLAVDPNNREAWLAWQTLIQTKRKQLGKPANVEPLIGHDDPGVNGPESRDPRLAS